STEVHILDGRSNFQYFSLHTGTALSESGSNWKFLVTNWNGDSYPDLVGIKKSQTGSHSTEVHILQAYDWFVRYLPHFLIAVDARGMYVRDGAITRNDMLALFNQVEKDGIVSADELASLRVLCGSEAAELNMSDYVRELSRNVVYGNPANAHYQGGVLGDL